MGATVFRIKSFIFPFRIIQLQHSYVPANCPAFAKRASVMIPSMFPA